MTPKQLPDGRWRFRYRPGGRNGPRMQVTLGADLAYAEALREMRRVVGKGALKRVFTRATIGDLAARYEEIHIPKLSKSWGKTSTTYLAERILPALGSRPADKLTALDLERYRRARLADKASAVVVNRELSVLSSVLARAVAWGLLDKHPIPRGAFSQLPEPEGRLVFFEREEWEKFRHAFDDQALWKAYIRRTRGSRGYGAESERAAEYRERLQATIPVFEALLYTCSRLTEILDLTWRDVDLQRGRVRVHQGKTDRPKTVPISSELRRVFESRKRGTPAAVVFQRPSGGAWDPAKVKAAFRTARSLAGLRKELTVHTLRHTGASWMVMAGVPLRTVQEFLGHASIESTLVYAHLSPDHMRDAAEAIAGVKRGREVDAEADK